MHCSPVRLLVALVPLGIAVQGAPIVDPSGSVDGVSELVPAIAVIETVDVSEFEAPATTVSEFAEFATTVTGVETDASVLTPTSTGSQDTAVDAAAVEIVEDSTVAGVATTTIVETDVFELATPAAAEISIQVSDQLAPDTAVNTVFESEPGPAFPPVAPAPQVDLPGPAGSYLQLVEASPEDLDSTIDEPIPDQYSIWYNSTKPMTEAHDEFYSALASFGHPFISLRNYTIPITTPDYPGTDIYVEEVDMDTLKTLPGVAHVLEMFKVRDGTEREGDIVVPEPVVQAEKSEDEEYVEKLNEALSRAPAGNGEGPNGLKPVDFQTGSEPTNVFKVVEAAPTLHYYNAVGNVEEVAEAASDVDLPLGFAYEALNTDSNAQEPGLEYVPEVRQNFYKPEPTLAFDSEKEPANTEVAEVASDVNVPLGTEALNTDSNAPEPNSEYVPDVLQVDLVPIQYRGQDLAGDVFENVQVDPEFQAGLEAARTHLTDVITPNGEQTVTVESVFEDVDIAASDAEIVDAATDSEAPSPSSESHTTIDFGQESDADSGALLSTVALPDENSAVQFGDSEIASETEFLSVAV